MNARNESGFVLVMLLLFLVVLSLLALSVFEINVLENKMNNFYWNKIKSFYVAESRLLMVEQKKILGINGEIPGVKVTPIDVDCGVTFFRLVAIGERNGVKTVLQSTVAVVGDVINCNPKPNVTPGRQSFLMEVER